jgi:hypothetical protein
MYSRRDVLAASAMGAVMTVSAAKAGSFGNPDQPAQGAINAKNPASITDPGPQDPAIRDQLQLAFSPPPTDCSAASRTAARMGVFNTGPHVVTMDFNPGDIGYVPKNYGHYVQNIGDTDMQFFAVFRTSKFAEFSLSDWLAHSPQEMVAEHLNVDPTIVPYWPGSNALIMPGRG